MKPALLLVLVWSLTLFAGCHALDGDDGGDGSDPTPTPSETPGTGTNNTTEPDPTPDPTDDPEPVQVTINILNHTTSVNVDEDVTVSWRVETVPNSTIAMTEVLFSNATFTTDDAANATSAGKSENVPGEGNFTATFKATEAGKVFIRAHAVVDDTDHYTDIVEVEVKTAGAVGGTTHIITIGSRIVEAGGVKHSVGAGSSSFFTPQTRTIVVGDYVVWQNNDTQELAHSAVDCGNPTGTDPCSATPRWQTPNIGAGDTSVPIQFTTAGRYNYYCGVHPTSATMGEAAAGQTYIQVAAS